MVGFLTDNYFHNQATSQDILKSWRDEVIKLNRKKIQEMNEQWFLSIADKYAQKFRDEYLGKAIKSKKG